MHMFVMNIMYSTVKIALFLLGAWYTNQAEVDVRSKYTFCAIFVLTNKQLSQFESSTKFHQWEEEMSFFHT